MIAQSEALRLSGALNNPVRNEMAWRSRFMVQSYLQILGPFT